MDFAQEQPRQYAGHTTFPDLMNDSAFATNNKGKERDFEEPDTCRICRGEGTLEEPLFYPCKCSGSIKFVHQPCLVEWLSHSQKKHCELCKTPFRFTKLYDPNMPRNLPAPLFLKQLLIHSFRTVVTWLRFILVAFVWLGWLPWSMRAIWRALFWLADGHWSGGDASQQLQARQSAGNGTTSLAAGMTTLNLQTPGAVLSNVTNSSSFYSPMSSMFTFPSGDPLLLTVAKKVMSALFFPAMSSPGGSSNSRPLNVTTGLYRHRHPSWLSDVKLLNSLTPSPTINNIVIDTLEGQLITLLVVVSFILVFLIREWVVQQQPMANIADGEREAAVQLIANNRPNRNDDRPRPEPRAHVHRADVLGDEGDRMEEHGSDHDDVGLLDIHFPQPTRRRSLQSGESADLPATEPVGRAGPPTFSESGSDSDNEANARRLARRSPTRVNQGGWAGVETFRDLWSRGNGDPEQILNIIREDGREEELSWVVTAMTRLQQNDTPRFSEARSSSSTQWDDLETSGYRSGASSIESSHLAPSGPAEISDSAPTYRAWDAVDMTNSAFETDSSIHRHEFTFGFPEFEPEPEISTGNNGEGQLNSTNNHNDEVSSNPQPASPQDLPTVGHANDETAPRDAQVDLPAAPPPRSFATKAFEWFWADLAPREQDQERPPPDDEEVVEDLAVEAPFVPIRNNRRPANDMQQNQGIAADAGIDPNDLDAVEEGDDLEGILELIGMQGPIFGLLQNGVFSALLISFTVAIGVWLPYLWGKIALVLLANPIQLIFGVPVTAVSVIADVTLDTLIGSLGYLMYAVSLVCKVLLGPLSSFVPLGDWIPQTKSITSASLSLIDASSHRLKNVVSAFFVFHESDVPVFSVLSHQALRIHQARISGLCQSIVTFVKFIIHDLPLQITTNGLLGALSFDRQSIDLSNLFTQARQQAYSFADRLFFPGKGAKWFDATVTGATSTGLAIDPELAVWDTKDRIIAIVMGYVLASILGLLYLRITSLFTGASRGQRVEGLVADVLHQAGGVMKVILIIGIEMIVFPLYCGTLLDVALLPLFENATIASRLEFTSSSPLTSLFVHWFIGTCYMFHFALFVSMCRKIMRSGVLYFIRDPDDPTFHPVRDVLERNITTQLRKIAFSALVYGALVIVCLGGVVWGLYYAFDGVLPVRWSATIPVLEFPADLLFYNFAMPLAIRSIKPSDGLHKLYNWWFHKCARFLRLSSFFFGERHTDEEGYHVRRTWFGLLSGKKGDTEQPIVGETERRIADEKQLGAYFVRDGKFVRAPASDQVRIPKGNPVFLEVTENDERVDGAPDPDEGLHGRANDMFTKVYIPPSFRTRIAAFIFLIWVFAAATGVGITIIPLVIGRKMMLACFPGRPLNDMYAFSLGICIFGSVAYLMFYCRTFLATIQDRLRPYLRSPRQALLGFGNVALSGLRLAYVFLAFSVLLPSLFALVMELYVIVPVHTYLGGTRGHVIHFVQDWTLGVLYVQMAIKFALWHSTSRPAAALNGVFQDGWLKPNVRLATRAIVLPVTILAALAVALPLSFGFALNSAVFHATPDIQAKVYRYAFPATLLLSFLAWLVYMIRRQVDIWRVNIRDDVYLIGERLHNFREKRARDVGVSRRVITG
ncbi:ERAD-associated E3 ubiquitin-protein ligase doa10 [Aspergillus udagawae]|uniref:RING-type E3 ubiquitin transferase n=1 Tax=Aspergillus udagawae TaxID=91492 RepID=A0A8H3N889_9EURO|nr:ERAD-associated E3 ubiquitin-protein ligase doa10 [Aspergillus udagawae]